MTCSACSACSVDSLNSYGKSQNIQPEYQGRGFARFKDKTSELFKPGQIIERITTFIGSVFRSLFCISIDICNKMRSLITREVVKYNGPAPEYASDALRNNEAFMLEAIEPSDSAIRYASDALRK